MKVGILGGTFDPIHNGHLALIKAARKALGLQTVFVVPTYQTPLKHRVLTPVRYRVAMARLALRGLPWAKLSLDEVRRRRVSYTYQMLRRFRKRLGRGAEIYFVCGADLLRHLGRWRRPDEVRKLCRFAVARRPGSRIRGLPSNAVVFAMKPAPVSSTEVRKKLGRGGAKGNPVPLAVRRYIRKHGLYSS